MDKTLRALITDIEKELYQVAGIATQVYAQDKLAQNVENAFLMFFTDQKIKWKRFETFQTYVLDGTTGRATTPVNTTFKNYDDIYAIYPADSNRKLVMASGQVNPVSVTGNYPLQRMYDSTNIFRVLPITAVGSVTVVGRSLPTLPFALNDVVPFDSLAIKFHAVWQYLIDDGSNPGGVAKFESLFNERYQALNKAQSSEPIAFNGRGINIPTTYYESNP